jgi:hypothetical protein
MMSTLPNKLPRKSNGDFRENRALLKVLIKRLIASLKEVLLMRARLLQHQLKEKRLKMIKKTKRKKLRSRLKNL